MHKMVKVTAIFLNTDQTPVHGKEFHAKLYDNDLVLDDLLAESPISDRGSADFLFDLAKAKSFDSPNETRPDLYVALYKGKSIIFESKIKKNSDFLKNDPVSGEQSLTIDLGTFSIRQ